MKNFNDRELLELAAKAAGFGPNTCWTESEYPPKSGKHGALWNYVGYMDNAELWNPLTDDGDALRLAVKLKIDIDNMTDACYCEGEYDHDVFVEIENDDPYAATRRAITIVAAKIARGSKCE